MFLIDNIIVCYCRIYRTKIAVRRLHVDFRCVFTSKCASLFVPVPALASFYQLSLCVVNVNYYCKHTGSHPRCLVPQSPHLLHIAFAPSIVLFDSSACTTMIPSEFPDKSRA